MLTLRFQRQGKKKDFIFRIIAVDSKIAVNSKKSKEILGWWDPRINKFELKKERILYWISQGAQPSDSCYNLLVRAKIIEGKKRPITIRKKKEKKGKGGEAPSFAKAMEGKGEKREQAPATEEKPTEDKIEEKSEEKMEEKPVEETKDEVKPEEKTEEKPKKKVKEKKEEKKEELEVKKEVKEEPKTEEVKEEAKEESKEDKKEKGEKKEVPEAKTEK